MKKVFNLLFLLGISVLINIVEVFSFGLIFVNIFEKLIRPFSVNTGDVLAFSYLVLVFLFNVGLTIFLVSKKGISRFFYIHIPISIFGIILLVSFIGAFYR